MDKSEIVGLYKGTRNHKKQIQILAELNACDREMIVGILRENGCRMIFNVNGVDISLQANEIRKEYESGATSKALAKKYHISKKQILEVMGISEEEDGNTDSPAKEPEEYPAKQELLDKISGLECEIAAKSEEIERLVNENAILRQGSTIENDDYQQLCIRCNQYLTTIDVLVDKIATLKAVMRHE